MENVGSLLLSAIRATLVKDPTQPESLKGRLWRLRTFPP